jgi:hypothetical protein
MEVASRCQLGSGQRGSCLRDPAKSCYYNSQAHQGIALKTKATKMKRKNPVLIRMPALEHHWIHIWIPLCCYWMSILTYCPDQLMPSASSDIRCCLVQTVVAVTSNCKRYLFGPRRECYLFFFSTKEKEDATRLLLLGPWLVWWQRPGRAWSLAGVVARASTSILGGRRWRGLWRLGTRRWELPRGPRGLPAPLRERGVASAVEVVGAAAESPRGGKYGSRGRGRAGEAGGPRTTQMRGRPCDHKAAAALIFLLRDGIPLATEG